MAGRGEHDAVVLAAGGSARLGRPKQLLTVGGETLLQRTVRLVRGTAPTRMLVVLGAHADRLAPLVTGTTIVFNPTWETGMASSLSRAAAALAGRTRPVLIALVDQPCLAPDHLNALFAAFDGGRDVVTAYGEALGPPALLRAETLALAGTLKGDTGFRRLWAREHPAAIRRDALGRDLDTPHDVEDAIRDGLLDG